MSKLKNNITLRLTDEQTEFVKKSAEMLEVSEAKFIRMVLNSLMVNWASSFSHISGGAEDED